MTTKPSLSRLSRRAGVKSMSEDCYPLLQKIIKTRLDELVKEMILINLEKGTKTLTEIDVYNALFLEGKNITRSEFLGTKTVPKIKGKKK